MSKCETYTIIGGSGARARLHLRGFSSQSPIAFVVRRRGRRRTMPASMATCSWTNVAILLRNTRTEPAGSEGEIHPSRRVSSGSRRAALIEGYKPAMTETRSARPIQMGICAYPISTTQCSMDETR